MRSAVPKTLHRLCGRPMVLHVLDALAELPVERVVIVVGHGSTAVVKTVQAESPPGLALEFVEQAAPRGTGDALAVALTGFPESYSDGFEEGDLIVLPGTRRSSARPRSPGSCGCTGRRMRRRPC